ncbi:MAG: hypothetical protein CVV08_20940 [Gammaproteobacteria bacterium HGW-Gammaproteobacteria-12]|nr:MAG: hypothetical protein CVV08_20940 [Gammaproteobacteria bacterium HGW-Gammaproteobacteria-12]
MQLIALALAPDTFDFVDEPLSLCQAFEEPQWRVQKEGIRIDENTLIGILQCITNGSGLASMQIRRRACPGFQGICVEFDNIDRPTSERCGFIGVKQDTRTAALRMMQGRENAVLGLPVILGFAPVNQINQLPGYVLSHHGVLDGIRDATHGRDQKRA